VVSLITKKTLSHAYATGRGGIVTRGHAEIVETKADQFQIIITSIPFRVVKADMIAGIAELVQEKKLEGIKALRDESTKDIRVVIELKNGAQPQKVLNYLYKHTELKKLFTTTWWRLVDGVPQTLSLKRFLDEFVSNTVRQWYVVDVSLNFARPKSVSIFYLVLKKPLIISTKLSKLIRASKTCRLHTLRLIAKFKFSTLQATAILEMRLQRLANLERQKIRR
jgi:DNA gyrase subunit A